jgi:hypothetical protein
VARHRWADADYKHPWSTRDAMALVREAVQALVPDLELPAAPVIVATDTSAAMPNYDVITDSEYGHGPRRVTCRTIQYLSTDAAGPSDFGASRTYTLHGVPGVVFQLALSHDLQGSRVSVEALLDVEAPDAAAVSAVVAAFARWRAPAP